MIDVDHVDYQPKLSKPGQVAKHQCPMTCVTYCVATMTYFSVVTTAVSATTKHGYHSVPKRKYKERFNTNF